MSRRMGCAVTGASTAAALAMIAALSIAPAHAQEACNRVMAQDSTLNNLVDPPGYPTALLGTLGGVKRAGSGKQAMILIPGFGFSGDVFTEFMNGMSDRYRMYAVTLPGFGGTTAPPSPGPSTSFGEQTWSNAALGAIEQLMVDERIENPIVVGHWVGGTQLALRLAMKQPDKIRAVVLLAGAARMMVLDTAYTSWYSTPERRVKAIDRALAPHWFKTVTRETWDDNNFLPGDYAVNAVRGLRLWREAATPPIHVWVRYLCEYNAQDITFEMNKVTVPTLLLKPGLEGLWHEAGQNYMQSFCHDSWGSSLDGHPTVKARTIPNSRACPWFDQPKAVDEAIAEFLKSVK